jgi:hypothetical protein
MLRVNVDERGCTMCWISLSRTFRSRGVVLGPIASITWSVYFWSIFDDLAVLPAEGQAFIHILQSVGERWRKNSMFPTNRFLGPSVTGPLASAIYVAIHKRRNNHVTSFPQANMTIESATRTAVQNLIEDPLIPIPAEAKRLVRQTTFLNESILPTPFLHIEAAGALKCIEGAIANLIGKERFGYEQDINIDLQHSALFLLMAYISTIDGLGKQDNPVKHQNSVCRIDRRESNFRIRKNEKNDLGFSKLFKNGW